MNFSESIKSDLAKVLNESEDPIEPKNPKKQETEKQVELFAVGRTIDGKFKWKIEKKSDDEFELSVYSAGDEAAIATKTGKNCESLLGEISGMIPKESKNIKESESDLSALIAAMNEVGKKFGLKLSVDIDDQGDGEFFFDTSYKPSMFKSDSERQEFENTYHESLVKWCSDHGFDADRSEDEDAPLAFWVRSKTGINENCEYDDASFGELRDLLRSIEEENGLRLGFDVTELDGCKFKFKATRFDPEAFGNDQSEIDSFKTVYFEQALSWLKDHKFEDIELTDGDGIEITAKAPAK